jgi:hypothetical protein
VIAPGPVEVVSKLVVALSWDLQVTAVRNAFRLCSSQEVATTMNAHEIVFTTGDLIILLITMVWIALLLAVVACNSVRFRLWFSQITLANNAHQALKRSLAIHYAVHKIVSFLSLIARLSSASRLSSVLQNVTLVFVQEQELCSKLPLVVVHPALL